MVEKWKDIKGFEGKYQISNTGKVKSLFYLNTDKAKIMSPRLNKRGVYSINLYKNNKAYNFNVGLLVARHFLKKENENDVVIHIGDKKDDNVKNLRYVSQSEARYYEKHKMTKNVEIERMYTSGQIRNSIKIAKENEIQPHQLYKRLYEGWEIEEARNIPINRNDRILKKKMYKYKEKLYSIKKLAEISNGISEMAIRKRLARGWSVDEAVNIPLNKYKKRKR